MDDLTFVDRLMAGDPTLFEGATARHSLGWLHHVERCGGEWLDDTASLLPRRHGRTLLLGMGGSSSPARFYADGRPESTLTVLDTSNPDTVSATDFSAATVIASSKSGTTIETQTLLAHALASGLDAADLVIVTDPGTSLGELGRSLGALVIEGDPDTGGRFSGLSPFGLVPALYAGWTPEELREETAVGALTASLVRGAIEEATERATRLDEGIALFALGGDPVTDGASLWLEQLIAETTGKDGHGFVPVAGSGVPLRPGAMQHYHLVAALLARRLGVNPFDQPNVESAKKVVFAILRGEGDEVPPAGDPGELRGALALAPRRALHVYAPLSASVELARLRDRVDAAYGTTTAGLGPRYLHSTGQLVKGGPADTVVAQVVVRPHSTPQRIAGRHYSFHDLHRAQATSDLLATRAAGRVVFQIEVDDLDEAASILVA